MTNTKWLSALLAGTALTVASTAAMADSSFLTMSRNAAGQGVTFSVAPTADMPAAATSVTISGAVGQWIESIDNGNTETEFQTEADLTFSASTDTAIGNVSVTANANLESSTWSSYVGSLEFAPGATISGGFGGVYKADAYTAAGTFNATGVGDAAGSREHLAVAFASGPVNFGAMVFQGSDGYNAIGAMIGGDFGGANIKGVVQADEQDDFLAGIQASFAIDMFSLAVAANSGKGNPVGGTRDTDVNSGENWTSMTATASIAPMEGWKLAASYGTEDNTDDNNEDSSYTFSASWAPVAQYEVIAAYNEHDDGDQTLGVGVWFKF